MFGEVDEMFGLMGAGEDRSDGVEGEGSVVVRVLVGSPVEEVMSDAPTAEAREDGFDEVRG